MTLNGWLQLAIYVVVLLALAKPLGSYMARVYEGESTILSRVFGPFERLLYRLIGKQAGVEMGWKRYAVALLVFNLLGLLAVYAIQRAQGTLPLNPQGFAGVAPDLAFNTAASFASNTNWQAYGGETTMSYLTQMAALTVQNFVSAATGMAVVVALIRGLRARSASTLGNFWVDLTRGDAVHPAAPLNRAGALPRVTGRDPEPVRLRHRAAGGRFGPADPADGSCRLADRDQAAGHEWRRLLQRQLRASVRERHRTHQLRRGDRDPGDLRRPSATRSARWSGTPGRAGRCWPR